MHNKNIPFYVIASHFQKNKNFTLFSLKLILPVPLCIFILRIFRKNSFLSECLFLD